MAFLSKEPRKTERETKSCRDECPAFFKCFPPGKGKGRDIQAGHGAHPAAQFCHAFIGTRDGFAVHTDAARSFKLEDNRDLYPCVEPGHRKNKEPT